jgi:hypothetical protein
MRKIRLKLDTLAVESFETDATQTGAGTVRGHDQITTIPETERFTCKWGRTDYDTCMVQCECTNRQIRCKGI